MLKIPQNFTISLTDMSLITKKKKKKKKKKGNSNTNKLSCWNSSITAIITLYCKRFGVSLVLFFFISNEASKIGDK